MHTQKPLTLIKRNDRHMKIDTQMSMKCVDIMEKKKLNKLNITQKKNFYSKMPNIKNIIIKEKHVDIGNLP